MKTTVTLSVRYAAGHSYPETWNKCALFCPNCGEQTVWAEEGAGDYYVGAGFLCTSCECDFTIQGPHEHEPSEKDGSLQTRQRLAAIRA